MAFRKLITTFGTISLSSNIKQVTNFRNAATYKAAVLEKLNGPLVIEDVKQKNLNPGEVGCF